jgi:drug/metabolite transporter (DMT)-like permease
MRVMAPPQVGRDTLGGMNSDDVPFLWRGAALAIASAVLFGLAGPAAKLLLGAMDPQLLAGIFYLGAGLGLAAVHAGRALLRMPAPEAPLRHGDLPWLAVIVLMGGVLGPLLLMLGLARTDAATGSLLLNAEGLVTMGIAWWVFGENADRRILLGAFAILAGAVVLSWNGGGFLPDTGAGLILLACVAWGVDNNLTRGLSVADPVVIAMTKGLVAGATNTAIALALGATMPSWPIWLAAGIVGLAGIGISLVLFVLALRHLGTARTGAYFSTAPFIGAVVAVVLLGDAMTWQMLVAGALMGIGVWLHLTERHEHEHVHEAMMHEHGHVHDVHHQHAHEGPVTEPHSHWHQHVPLRHKHPHYPDPHHRHSHP